MSIQHPYRTHRAGQLRLEHAGQAVKLAGWVQSLRRFKRQTFIELREESGLVQLVASPEQSQGLTLESAICVEGIVQPRVQPHPQLWLYPTGEVEVKVGGVHALNSALELPFSVHEQAAEAIQLRYRPLSLRWGGAQRLRERAQAVQAMRSVVETAGFLEVETPVLVRNTPGGATPFLVNVGEGKGYALAQSPQIWKQLLICGGVERYYQLAHCFRNEGARPERQPEFSQFEIEMGFCTQEEVMQVMEEIVVAAARRLGHTMQPIPQMTYLQALAEFGTENVHLGNPLRLISEVSLPHTRFEQGRVELVLPQPLSREEEKSWLKEAWALLGEGVLEVKGATLIAQGPRENAQKALGYILRQAASEWRLIKSGIYPLWVHTFPLFEKAEQGHWVSAHHPFTRPLEGHEARFSTTPEAALAQAFDLVINGIEVGGGSMRIHEVQLQKEVLHFLGLSENATHFRPLLEALQWGAPPHGGMALGVERLVALLLGASSIREVMAFPKTTGGQCLLTEALS